MDMVVLGLGCFGFGGLRGVRARGCWRGRKNAGDERGDGIGLDLF